MSNVAPQNKSNNNTEDKVIKRQDLLEAVTYDDERLKPIFENMIPFDQQARDISLQWVLKKSQLVDDLFSEAHIKTIDKFYSDIFTRISSLGVDVITTKMNNNVSSFKLHNCYNDGVIGDVSSGVAFSFHAKNINKIINVHINNTNTDYVCRLEFSAYISWISDPGRPAINVFKFMYNYFYDDQVEDFWKMVKNSINYILTFNPSELVEPSDYIAKVMVNAKYHSEDRQFRDLEEGEQLYNVF